MWLTGHANCTPSWSPERKNKRNQNERKINRTNKWLLSAQKIESERAKSLISEALWHAMAWHTSLLHLIFKCLIIYSSLICSICVFFSSNLTVKLLWFPLSSIDISNLKQQISTSQRQTLWLFMTDNTMFSLALESKKEKAKKN